MRTQIVDKKVRVTALLLAAVLFFSAPGFESFNAFAVEIHLGDFSGPVGPDFIAPLGASDSPVPLKSLEGGLKEIAPLNADGGSSDIFVALPVSQEKEAPKDVATEKKSVREIGGRAPVGGGIKALQKNLAPEIEKLENPEISARASFSLGRKIWDIVSRRKNSNPATSALGAAPLEKSPPLIKAQSPVDGKLKADVPSPQNTDEVLAGLVKRPPAAVFFDYDMTLTDLDEKGMSRPVSDEILDGLKRLLRAGWPVGIVTSRSFDRQSAAVTFPNTLLEPLIQKIPEILRRNLFFVGSLGSEFVVFKNGNPVRYLDRDWSNSERERISKAISEALEYLHIPPEAVNVNLGNNAQAIVWFHQKNDPRLAGFADVLNRKLGEHGLSYAVMGGGKSVYFGKFDKGDGVSLIYSAMRERGFPASEDNLLFVGDQFYVFPTGAIGGDVSMALAFPLSRAIDVGEEMAGTLPENVVSLGLIHARGTIRVINELLKLPAPRPAGDFKKKMGLFWGAALAGVIAVIAAQNFGIMPRSWFLVSGPLDFLGTMGVLLLRFSSIPQLLDNFRLGRSSTADLSLKSTLLWLGASVVLSLVSILNHRSPIWIVSNVTGVLQGLLMLSQILFYNRSGFGKSLAALLAMALSVPLAFIGVGLPAAVWSSLLFVTAMGLVLTINIPQIAANYKLYRKEGRPPRINPFFPALLASGSLLSLLAALGRGDVYWTLTNLLSIMAPVTLLAQIYAPGRINSWIAKALGALRKAFRF